VIFRVELRSNLDSNIIINYLSASSIAFSNKSLMLMPASAACCGKILASVKPGTVFTSKR